MIPLDILSDDPISFTKRTFDVVVTCAMIENASKDLDEYVTALKNINKLLNSKGYLVLIGSFDTTYYSFNDTKFPSVKLDKNLAEKSLNEAGFDVLQWDVREEKQDPSLFDCSSMFGLIAQKRN